MSPRTADLIQELSSQQSPLHRSLPASRNVCGLVEPAELEATPAAVRRNTAAAAASRFLERQPPSQARHTSSRSSSSSSTARGGRSWLGGLVDAWGNALAGCGSTLGSAWENAFAECGGGGGGGDGEGRASATREYEVIGTGRRRVRVPCGRPVTEEDWALLDARRTATFAAAAAGGDDPAAAAGARAVSFSGRNTVHIVPNRRQLFRTRAKVREHFFSKRQTRRVKKEIAQGQGREEWVKLLTDVRQEAHQARRKLRLQKQQQQQQQHVDEPIGRLLAFFGFV